MAGDALVDCPTLLPLLQPAASCRLPWSLHNWNLYGRDGDVDGHRVWVSYLNELTHVER